MKFLKFLCVLAIMLCLTASVYAETQSVKVSGDLTMRGIFRNNYAYLTTPPESAAGAATGLGNIDSAQQNFFMTVAEVEVDADLTDNVTTVIRLLNQRDWNVYSRDINQGSNPTPNGRGFYTGNSDEFNVIVDLAYVQLKDFIYSPLTLTIGRQDLWFGKGFIVGANLQNPGVGTGTTQGNLLTSAGNLSAPEYTGVWSFDAVKAVLDFDPWTITGVYSKIYGDAIQANDDINLYGVNVGYKFNKFKAEAEGYWFWKQDRSLEPLVGNLKGNGNDVHTFGLRGSMDPLEYITLNAEGAVQGGSYVGSDMQSVTRNRLAWALDVGGECRYLTDKVMWKPKFGVEYIYYSGNEPESNPGQINNSTYTGWDSMYRGKFDSAIREFVGRFYASNRYPARADQNITCNDSALTNQHQVVFTGSVTPMESLVLKANYNLFWNQEDYVTTSYKSGGFIGQEIDLQANWDYTEDVSFGLLAGWFVPGEVYQNDRANIATDIVGTVKVSF